MKRIFQPCPANNRDSVGRLLLRIVVGAAFIFHGLSKMHSPFGWMGPDSPVPGFLQFLAAFAELGGGIAWIIGLLMPLASAGILCTMTVAAFLQAIVLGGGFVTSAGPSYEVPLVYWSIAFYFLLVGPGGYSGDAKIFGIKSTV